VSGTESNNEDFFTRLTEMKQQMLIMGKRELMQTHFIKQERRDGVQTKQGMWEYLS
jgi:hypothetical protein